MILNMGYIFWKFTGKIKEGKLFCQSNKRVCRAKYKYILLSSKTCLSMIVANSGLAWTFLLGNPKSQRSVFLENKPSNWTWWYSSYFGVVTWWDSDNRRMRRLGRWLNRVTQFYALISVKYYVFHWLYIMLVCEVKWSVIYPVCAVSG